jgi:IMP dehydrogenase
LGRVLVGMATNRDLRLSTNLKDTLESVMIPFDQLTVITCENLSKMPSPFEIQQIMTKKRIEKIPIVNSRREILGLATLRDIQRLSERPFANLDKRGQLYVGAAIGANQLDRASALVQAGVDVLVVDMANGHSILCINTVKELK